MGRNHSCRGGFPGAWPGYMTHEIQGWIQDFEKGGVGGGGAGSLKPIFHCDARTRWVLALA